MSPTPSIQSSGDLIADRRYAFAAALSEAGDHLAAADLLRQTLELTPHWAVAWRALGRALSAGGEMAGAAAAYRKALAADPDDQLGASLELARLDAGAAVNAAPPAWIAALFDAYAPTFDNALVETLDYRAPQLIAARLAALIGRPAGWGRALDLGCGTGLMAEALARRAGWLEGVDLSAGMLEAARAKSLYDALDQDDLHAALIRRSMADAPAFDIILAADVLIYAGDLAPIATAAAAQLAPGGRIAVTLEALEPDLAPDVDWRLRESLRFAHSRAYARRVFTQAGLQVDALDAVTLRLDRGEPVAGWLVVARRPEAAEAADAAGCGVAKAAAERAAH
ncbi:MAG: methyltransferase domain-containing protein [Alphaproteobacteria bacterium]|nr:methyltransferase domain-containing protein [Alphaproteobacteria bacterium]